MVLKKDDHFDDLHPEIDHDHDDASNVIARKAILVLESLLENPRNHDLFQQLPNGVPLLLRALHHRDSFLGLHAATTLHRLSLRRATCVHLILEGAVLHLLEMQEEGTPTWRVCLTVLRNMWRDIRQWDVKMMLFAVLRVAPSTATGAFRGHVMLALVHLLDPSQWISLLPEGLLDIFLALLSTSSSSLSFASSSPRVKQQLEEDGNLKRSFRHVAAAMKHMLQTVSYEHAMVPKMSTVDEPRLRQVYDRHQEVVDVEFVVEGRRLGVNRVVLSVQNAYFKSLVRS
jgi:hypothetical protein